MTREEVAKALSRKPVEGYSEGPWKATGAAPASNGYGIDADDRMPIATTTGYRKRKEERANGDLLSTAPDLQDENQVLQVAVRQLREALMIGREYLTYSMPRRRVGMLTDDIKTVNDALALMPTEGENDDAIER